MFPRLTSIALGAILATHLLAQQPLVDLGAEPVHAMVDQPPEYPGGTMALKLFLVQHMNIPDSVMALVPNGTVKVRFVVDRTGSVRDPKIIFSMHPAIDAEALRIIGGMPLWQPGRLRGKPVNVMYVLPIMIG